MTLFTLSSSKTLLLWLLAWSSCSADLTQRKFEKEGDFNNVFCTGGVLWEAVVRSVSECVSLCARQNGCESVFYNKDGGSCTASAEIGDPSDPGCNAALGSAYYIMEAQQQGYGGACVASAECRDQVAEECRQGECLCKPGYSAFTDVSGTSCIETTDCDSVAGGRGTTLQEYQDSFLGLQSLHNGLVGDVQSCIDLCTVHYPTNCLSVDFIPQESFCSVNYGTALTHPGSYTSYPGSVHYVRNCI